MICSKCNIEKPEEEFNWSRKNIKRRRDCKECFKILTSNHYQNHKAKYVQTMKTHDQKYRDRNRKFLIEYLKTKSCVDCSNTDIRVLQFDHVRGKKLDGIAQLVAKKYSISKIEIEIAKCEVRCANCHIIKTAKEFGFWWSALN